MHAQPALESLLPVEGLLPLEGGLGALLEHSKDQPWKLGPLDMVPEAGSHV